jgi:hypothetical protein
MNLHSISSPQGYKDELESTEMQSMVPAGLQGKADILFGNLLDIYTFHSDVFLKDLENSICMTELVALCFVQRVSAERYFLVCQLLLIILSHLPPCSETFFSACTRTTAKTSRARRSCEKRSSTLICEQSLN